MCGPRPGRRRPPATQSWSRGAAPSGQPVRGIQEVHQPFAFTALPGKIWHGRQSPLSVWMNRQL
jgi:hypothetical protein